MIRNRTEEYQQFLTVTKFRPKSHQLIKRKFDDEVTFDDAESVSEIVHFSSLRETDFKNLRKRMDILKELHKEHSTVSFGKDYEDEESQIQIQTKAVQKLFKKMIKSLSYFQGDELYEQTQVLQMKKNLKAKLNIQLNELSIEFKEDQKKYIQKLKEIKSRKKQLNLNYQQEEIDSEVTKKLENLQDQIFAKGMSEEEMSEILKTQREIIERDQELETVLTSIVELQGLFKEIHEAVIEQGTMLDRIDNNIDNAQTNISESVGHLQSAEQYQKKSTWTMCIIITIMVIAFIIAILLTKLL
eukprot:gene6203-10209_t